MRMKPLAYLLLELLGRSSQVHRGLLDGFHEQKLHAEEKHEHKAEQFHARLDIPSRKERSKTSESNKAVKYFPSGRSQADHKCPKEPASGAFVHDGEIDRPNRNGKNEPAQKACHPGKE